MTMANGIRQDEIITRSIERLPLAEQLAGKFLAQKVAPFACGSMHDEDRIPHDTLVVALRSADGAIVHPQLGQSFTRGEMKVAKDEVAGLGSRVFRRTR